MIRASIIAEQRQRLDELCQIRRELTDSEIDEVLKLSRLERARESKRVWRNENIEEERRRCAEWRQSRKGLGNASC